MYEAILSKEGSIDDLYRSTFITVKKETGYRLLWFQHMHKSAGTSIVKMAEKNGEKLFPHNINGNPLKQNGKIKELWRYSGRQIETFIDACEEQSVTFVATEWGAPDFEILKKDKRVVAFTCLREPIDRYISNYWFDFYYSFTKCNSLMDYKGSRGLWTMDNYYCRILSGIDNQNHLLNKSDYEKACNNLRQLDYYFALENGKDFNLFINGVGWEHDILHVNKTGSFFRQSLSNIKNKRLGLVWRRIRYWKKNPDKHSLSKLKTENMWDVKLYNYVFYNPKYII